MGLRFLKLKNGAICFGSCTSTVSQSTFVPRLDMGSVPAKFLYDMHLYATLLPLAAAELAAPTKSPALRAVD